MRIPKNQVLIGILMSDEPFITYYDTNKIDKIEDNSKGVKGTADYFIHYTQADGELEIDELNSVGFINMSYKEFEKISKWK